MQWRVRHVCLDDAFRVAVRTRGSVSGWRHSAAETRQPWGTSELLQATCHRPAAWGGGAGGGGQPAPLLGLPDARLPTGIATTGPPHGVPPAPRLTCSLQGASAGRRPRWRGEGQGQRLTRSRDVWAINIGFIQKNYVINLCLHTQYVNQV